MVTQPLARLGPGLGLACGVAVVSTAALLVRWALDAGADPLAVAAARLSLAALLIWPICWWTSAPRPVPGGRGAAAESSGKLGSGAAAESSGKLRTGAAPRGQIALWILIAGASLAVHFAAWISSLHYTSVASSVALVTTNPIWVALGAWLVFGNRPGGRVWIAIALSIAGSALISWSDLAAAATAQTLPPENQPAAAAAPGAQPLLGNALALLGALAMSGYMLAAQAVKRLDDTLGLLRYVAVVYSVAALLLSGCAWLAGTAWWELPAPAWPALLLLALGPQLIGHTLINHALRYLAPTVVALAILGEPIGAALLAAVLLGEAITPGQLLGFALVVAAVVLAR